LSFPGNRYGSSKSSSSSKQSIGKTEFEILKASHKFLREDDVKNLSWDEKMAQKYYDSLYREFAVCDLKHYKSGNFALRWRTEAEVLSGAGEETCGNTRCAHHSSPRESEDPIPPLTTLELPFAYVEQGENKSALVKMVLCNSCCKKLMWKRQKEKEREGVREPESSARSRRQTLSDHAEEIEIKIKDEDGVPTEVRSGKTLAGRRDRKDKEGIRRTRNSRSLSPRPRSRHHSDSPSHIHHR